ncbi:MAG: MarR family winged helix-turn-helix transcriptional regulator, partial [Candidatus Kapaibacterium sp.]
MDMILEQRIRQGRPFRSEQERAAVNVLYSATWILEHMRAFLADFGVTHQQYNVLRILRGQHPQSISTCDIRERMIDRASDASRIVDRMIAKNLVRKAPSQRDKRRIDVTITEEGLALLEAIESAMERPDSVLRGLTESECAQLNVLLDKMKTA